MVEVNAINIAIIVGGLVFMGLVALNTYLGIRKSRGTDNMVGIAKLKGLKTRIVCRKEYIRQQKERKGNVWLLRLGNTTYLKRPTSLSTR